LLSSRKNIWPIKPVQLIPIGIGGRGGPKEINLLTELRKKDRWGNIRCNQA